MANEYCVHPDGTATIGPVDTHAHLLTDIERIVLEMLGEYSYMRSNTPETLAERRLLVRLVWRLHGAGHEDLAGAIAKGSKMTYWSQQLTW